MNLTDILGIGGDQPLVDMNDDDEMSASARAPGSPTAPVTTAPDNPTPPSNFLDAILGIAPEQGRKFRSSLGAGLTAVAQNYDKPAMAAFAAGAGGALAGKTAPPNLQNKLSALDRAIRARHAGDMDELKRALADLHWAQRAPQATAAVPPLAGYADFRARRPAQDVAPGEDGEQRIAP